MSGATLAGGVKAGDRIRWIGPRGGKRQGTVIELVDACGYSLARIRTSKGGWTAVNVAALEVIA